LYIPVSALIILLLIVFGISVFMKVLEIKVTGVSMYTDEQIISASGIMQGDNTLFIDTDAAARTIHKELPFIRDVTITRVPPSTVLIEITESKALAGITYKNSVLIIDSNCKVLVIMDNLPDGLIDVRGLSIEEPVEGSPIKVELGNETQLQYLKDVLDAIEKENIERDISYLDVSNTSRISFEYLGKFRVILGNPSSARNKLNKLHGIVAKIRAERSGGAEGEIDMTDPTGEGEYIYKPKPKS